MLNKRLNKRLINQLKSQLEEIGDLLDKEELDREDWADYHYIITEADPDDVLKEFFYNSSLKEEELDKLRQINKEVLVKAIINNTEVSAVNSFYLVNNEVFSLITGEKEYQIITEDFPELTSLIKEASKEELKEVNITDRQEVIIYGRPHERLIWVIDNDRLLEELSSEGVIYA